MADSDEFDVRPVRAFRPGAGAEVDESVWPASVPAMAQLLREGLELPAGLTVLVGENGSGKSTVVETLAEASQLFTYLEEHPGRAVERLHELSHGESFLEILRTRVNQTGFNLMDEPDAPLSFTASLGLAALLHDLVAGGSQAVIATHSPIVAAVPGAHLLELGPWGIRPATWDDLSLVVAWRGFLRDPQAYFRHLLSD
jgi:predicted ATPase